MRASTVRRIFSFIAVVEGTISVGMAGVGSAFPVKFAARPNIDCAAESDRLESDEGDEE
jgi:hypothetical protein